MSEEGELAPLSLTVNSRRHAVSLNIDPANECLNIRVKDTRTKEVLIQRVDAKYIEGKDCLAAIGDFSAVHRYILRNIWDITIQNGTIRFKGDKAISIGLRSAGTSWNDLGIQSINKLDQYLQERDIKIAQLQRSSNDLEKEIVAIRAQSAEEIARIQKLIQANREEQARINSDFEKKVADLDSEVKKNKKDQDSVNSTLQANISTLDKKVEDNKKAQDTVNTTTSNNITALDNKVNTNKSQQTNINKQVRTELDWLMLASSVDAINTLKSGPHYTFFSLVNITSRHALLKLLSNESGFFHWFNFDNILDRRIKYQVKFINAPPAGTNMGSSSSLAIANPSLIGGGIMLSYDGQSGWISSGEIGYGFIDKAVTGSVIVLDFDFPAKRFTFSFMGGKSISGEMSENLYKGPMHLYVAMGLTGMEAEIKVIS